MTMNSKTTIKAESLGKFMKFSKVTNNLAKNGIKNKI